MRNNFIKIITFCFLSLIFFLTLVVFNTEVKAFSLETVEAEDKNYTALIRANSASKSVTLSVNLISENINFYEYKDISGVLSIGTCNSQSLKFDSTKICVDLGAFNVRAFSQNQILGEFKFKIINPRLPAKIISTNSIYEEGIEIKGTLFDYNGIEQVTITPTKTTTQSTTDILDTPPKIVGQVNILLCAMLGFFLLAIAIILYILYEDRKKSQQNGNKV